MLCHQSRDDKRVDLPEFKNALPLLVSQDCDEGIAENLDTKYPWFAA